MTMPVCFWMEFSSHHQSAIFAALARSGKFDLQVRYACPQDPARRAQGWVGRRTVEPYERQLTSAESEDGALLTVPDWRNRVHIVSPFNTPGVAGQLHQASATICYWAEMPGIRIAKIVGYRMGLFNLADGASAIINRRRYRLWRTRASRVLVQGRLARQGFARRGVDDSVMRDFFHAPPGFDVVDDAHSSKDLSRSPCHFVYVGRLEKQKGTDVLLKAFSRLSDKECRLALIGLDTGRGRYQGLVRRLGIADRVRFVGVIPSDCVGVEISESDVLVLPSRFDGWGAALNEGASVGLALIGTDMCGASFHAIEEGVNGFVVRRSKVRPLQEVMGRYAASAELRRDHGAASLQRYEEVLSPEANVRRLLAALDGVKPSAD